ncbi:SAM-dependent methyltransferase [Candidatus Woesearchaeota archaeon]|nr:SAM-dependent methyltransferase [Candidatus Woesearchaeota archaeon]|tara:strand:- start:9741 stop:10565 length:825 start_codon:yes stop_codon:yes gene_type:complete
MTRLKQALKGKLTAKEFSYLRASFDVIGDIAIIEIPDELIKKEKLIAETLLNMLKNVKVVCKKAGIHKGVFRTQKLKVLAGEKRKETIHKENDTRIKINVEKVYFSSRLSTERKRIYQLIKPGESVLVMFSGCAPYPCVISKNTKAKEIYAIEINPVAHKYAEENVKLNKIDNVKLFLGDVKDIIPKLRKRFDRIVMPLPKSAENFLDTALACSKKGTVVHFYDFLNEKEFEKAHDKIDKACKRNKRKYKILRTVKCGQFSPGVFRVCVDFKVS